MPSYVGSCWNKNVSPEQTSPVSHRTLWGNRHMIRSCRGRQSNSCTLHNLRWTVRWVKVYLCINLLDFAETETSSTYGPVCTCDASKHTHCVCVCREMMMGWPEQTHLKDIVLLMWSLMMHTEIHGEPPSHRDSKASNIISKQKIILVCLKREQQVTNDSTVTGWLSLILNKNKNHVLWNVTSSLFADFLFICILA